MRLVIWDAIALIMTSLMITISSVWLSDRIWRHWAESSLLQIMFRRLSHAKLDIDIIMSAMTSQITSVSIVCSICSGSDRRKHRTSWLLAFVRVIHKGLLCRERVRVMRSLWIYKWIFSNKNVSISSKTSLQSHSVDPIDENSTWFRVVVWYQT